MDRDFQKALTLKHKQDSIREELFALRKMNIEEESNRKLEISAENIARTVSNITHIPLTRLVKSEVQKLSNLEQNLSSRIIGQEEAITAIAATIRRSRAMITPPQRPLGSFLFLGPTGVGKTETAKVLAETVFEDPGALIRVDMSEFM